MTTLNIVFGFCVILAWLAVLTWVVRRILEDTEPRSVARVVWIVVAVLFPVGGPLVWAFVRWQVPDYAHLQLR